MPKNYIVQKGDGISSISFAHGLKPETIWGQPENKNLRDSREDPNILLDGDMLVIPDIRPFEYEGNTEIRHRFRRLGVPAKFRLQLLEGDDIRANLKYRLEVEGQILEGATDEKGMLDVFVPNNASKGKLFLFDEKAEEQIEVLFGWLDPIDLVNGAQQRLKNLGFDCGAVDGELGPKTEDALKRFQQAANLEPTGKLDEETSKELLRLHDTNALFPDDDGTF